MALISPTKRTLLINTWSNAFNDPKNTKRTFSSSNSTYRQHGNLNPGHHLLYTILRGGNIFDAFSKRTNEKIIENSGFQEYQGLAYAMYYIDEVMEAISIVEEFDINTIREQSLKTSERRKEYSLNKEKKFYSYKHILRERLKIESARVQYAQDKIDRFIKPLRGVITNCDIQKAYSEIEKQLEENNIEIYFVKSPHYEYTTDI